MGAALPAQLTSFIGREDEVAAVHDALGVARLVTLTGAGGCGKTRLALFVASARADTHPDGVWFVDLSLVEEDAGVERALLHAAELALPLEDAIGTRAALVVLDNCEHVIEGSAALADALLRACPALTILATSREPLGVAGEVVYRVPSLDTDDAAELFVQRAARARPGHDPDHDAVVDICDRLDGIPLAIELAAARMRVFSATQIRDGLHDRFRLLTGGARTAVQRQQTLQASVDWSHDLLLDAERVVLRRLSVFAGGFALDGAERVASGGDVAPHHVLDLLSQLVDKSLVSSDGERFRLLETVRQYAADRLVAAGESEATRRRHHEWMLELVRHRREIETYEEHRARINADYENIRRALQWSSDLDDPMPFVSLCLAMHGYWAGSRRITDGATWLELANERAVVLEGSVRARVMRSYPYLRGLSGDWLGAYEPSLAAVSLAREVDDPRNLMWTLLQHASICVNVGHSTAELVDEALAIADEIGDDRGRASALFMLGFRQVRDEARAADALATCEEALEVARRVGFVAIELNAMVLVALAATFSGEIAGAVGPLEQAATALRGAGEGFYLPQVLGLLVEVHSVMGDVDATSAAQEELDELARESVDPMTSVHAALGRGLIAWQTSSWAEWIAPLRSARGSFGASSMEGVLRTFEALFLAYAGEHEEAAAVAREVEHGDVVNGLALPASAVAGIVALAAGDVDRAEDRLLAGFEHLSRRDVTGTNRVTMLTSIARVFAQTGRAEDAARALGSADAFCESVGIVVDLEGLFPMRPAAIDVARDALGDERFAELRAEGATMTRDETVAWLVRGRGRRKRPSSGWESLTPTERQVVELVAEGLANMEIAGRLFVSVTTVKSHLTHVFVKTGLTTRAQVAAEWVRRSPGGGSDA